MWGRRAQLGQPTLPKMGVGLFRLRQPFQRMPTLRVCFAVRQGLVGGRALHLRLPVTFNGFNQAALIRIFGLRVLRNTHFD